MEKDHVVMSLDKYHELLKEADKATEILKCFTVGKSYSGEAELHYFFADCPIITQYVEQQLRKIPEFDDKEFNKSSLDSYVWNITKEKPEEEEEEEESEEEE